MQIIIVNGSQALSYMNDIADLRICCFREYPYLYDGTVQGEQEYLEIYFRTENSVFVIVIENQKVVGVITGIPIEEFLSPLLNLLDENEIATDSIFYFGDMILCKRLRGKGIGHQMYKKFEEWVRSKKKYKEIVGCTIIRPYDDLRKPKNYVSLDGYWIKKGFVKHPKLVVWFPWREVGTNKEIQHPLCIWSKNLLDEDGNSLSERS